MARSAPSRARRPIGRRRYVPTTSGTVHPRLARGGSSMSHQIHWIVEFHVKDGQRDGLEALVHEMVAATEPTSPYQELQMVSAPTARGPRARSLRQLRGRARAPADVQRQLRRAPGGHGRPRAHGRLRHIRAPSSEPRWPASGQSTWPRSTASRADPSREIRRGQARCYRMGGYGSSSAARRALASAAKGLMIATQRFSGLRRRRRRPVPTACGAHATRTVQSRGWSPPPPARPRSGRRR